MAYWGGAGVVGDLHHSLQAYIDCFESAPFPKMYPRGGGVWDQDPCLMRDFRLIRSFAVKWKDNQRQLDDIQNQATPGGGAPDMNAMLEQYISEMGDDGDF